MNISRRDFLKMTIASTMATALAGLPELEREAEIERIVRQNEETFKMEVRVGSERGLGSLENSSSLFKDYRTPIGLRSGKYVFVGNIESLSLDYGFPGWNNNRIDSLTFEGIKESEEVNIGIGFVSMSSPEAIRMLSRVRRPIEITGSASVPNFYNGFVGIVLTFYDCMLTGVEKNTCDFQAIPVPELDNKTCNIYMF